MSEAGSCSGERSAHREEKLCCGFGKAGSVTLLQNDGDFHPRVFILLKDTKYLK